MIKGGGAFVLLSEFELYIRKLKADSEVWKLNLENLFVLFVNVISE